MIGRFLKGLILGLLIGGAAAFALIKGLHVLSFAVGAGSFAFVAFASALVTGAVVGLIAGKPIWSEGAWIEGLLKTFFGALLGAGAMYLARRFGGMEFPFESLGLGSGPIGQLPITTLPAIATLLSVFYEVDNTDSPQPAAKGRVAKPVAKVRAGAGAIAQGDELDDELEAPKKAKK